ncbi:PAS domain-containing sensor histidine kinase [Ulvibacter litoralis]|uniref:histidine kinase n=1 Tax=Ulvibacter litoralis TaxID=227084 RepID=A0A1G7CK49_9FLAO|nr:PAS domain S-box protein [Ulvibacter litoralis]GHC47036.1 hypothetical protein GCM10008083_07680 [Ulvibacter litoralis]SDE39748.1 PAS domain S-box-containing protein [Ulvibacter litoralis]
MTEEVSIEIMQKALLRERQARKEAESIALEASKEVHNLRQELKDANFKLASFDAKKNSEIENVFENVNDAYILVDEKGNLKKLNNFATELFNLGAGSKKKNIKDVIYYDDLALYKKAFKKVLTEGAIKNFKIRIYKGNGEIRLLQINGIGIYDTEGNPIGAHGIARDVTEDVSIKNQIEEQKEQLDIIIKNSPVGITLFKEFYKGILVINPALLDMLGYTREEFFEVEETNLTYPEDQEITDKYQKMLTSGEVDSYRLEKRYLKKDGSILWTNTYAKSIKGEDGKIKYHVGIVEDITSIRQKTLALDYINTIAISILGKIDIYEIAKIITGQIASYLETNYCELYLVNKEKGTFKKITGFDYVEQFNSPINDDLEIELENSIVGTVVKTGIAFIENDTTANPNYVFNDKVRLSQMAVPIINNGEIIGVINVEDKERNYYTDDNLEVLENIAGIVSMQLKNAINHIERIKAEDENKKLLIRLEHSNRELQDYAHIVSHDLKSPLRGISSLMSWIKEDHLASINAEVMSSFNLIDSKLQLMDGLITGILQYSSIDLENGTNEAVDINEVFQDIFKTLHVPNTINIEVIGVFPIISAHKVRIQQLFQNLISNAIKYNDKDRGEIYLSYSKDTDGYIFSVKDNGVGISEQFHERIFKMFSKLTNDIDSTGIGLSIVKKIVDLYDGEVWLESEEGVGTEFFIKLKQ